MGYAVPGWALGTALLVLFGGGSFWKVFPLGGFRSDNWEYLTFSQKIVDQMQHMFLPVLCYMVGSFASLTILAKNSLMENMSQDYVRTAFAKGLHKNRVIFVHALRNSLIPIATGLGHVFSLILAGSFLIEKVSTRRHGYLGYTSILQRDYPVLSAFWSSARYSCSSATSSPTYLRRHRPRIRSNESAPSKRFSRRRFGSSAPEARVLLVRADPVDVCALFPVPFLMSGTPLAVKHRAHILPDVSFLQRDRLRRRGLRRANYRALKRQFAEAGAAIGSSCRRTRTDQRGAPRSDGISAERAVPSHPWAPTTAGGTYL